MSDVGGVVSSQWGETRGVDLLWRLEGPAAADTPSHTFGATLTKDLKACPLASSCPDPVR